MFIKRAGLDGSDVTTLHKSEVTEDQSYGIPKALTLADDRLYWVDSRNLRLESILINGRLVTPAFTIVHLLIIFLVGTRFYTIILVNCRP